MESEYIDITAGSAALFANVLVGILSLTDWGGGFVCFFFILIAISSTLGIIISKVLILMKRNNFLNIRYYLGRYADEPLIDNNDDEMSSLPSFE